MICDKINSLGGSSNFMDGYETLKAALDEKISPGDLILFMGPEGLKEIADRLVAGQ
jgi:UDP-N-acetylmuramate-alanine ligase